MKTLIFALLFLEIFPFSSIVKGSPYYVVNIKCEYAVNPFGIDIETPRLSWNIKTQQRNWMQSAYQILVASDSLKLNQNNGDVWKIAADSNHVGTGFVSTPLILTGLSDMGYGELAYTMANQRTYPGWYDMVFNHGSKIFKEDWGGGLVQMPPLGGSLGYWFYYSLVGIQLDSSAPGFKNIIIRPDIVSDLSWVKGEYQSVYGNIKSEWKREKGRFILNIEIPANTIAKVFLPSANIRNITENGKPVMKNKDFYSIKVENEKTIIQTGSGNYSFYVKLND